MLTSLSQKRQSGLSLIELMVAIAISLILMAGVVTLVVRMSVAGGESVEGTRLNQSLRGALDRMSRDLQRAGYVAWWNTWDTDGDGELDNVNGDTWVSDGSARVDVLDFYDAAIPAISRFGDVALFDVSSDGSSAADCSTDCNCILFSYDLNQNGAQDVASGAGANQVNSGTPELFGYRLLDDQIETRTGGGGAANSCADGNWEAMTENDEVEITNLDFTLVYANAAGAGNDSTVYPLLGGASVGSPATSCTPGAGGIDDDKCLWRRNIHIELQGRLTDDQEVEMDLVTDVKIKNDHFQTQ